MVTDQDNIGDLGGLKCNDHSHRSSQMYYAQVIEEVAAEPVGQGGTTPGGEIGFETVVSDAGAASKALDDLVGQRRRADLDGHSLLRGPTHDVRAAVHLLQRHRQVKIAKLLLVGKSVVYHIQQAARLAGAPEVCDEMVNVKHGGRVEQ